MWWRNNGWLFIIGFCFALLCTAGLYFVTAEQPEAPPEVEVTTEATVAEPPSAEPAHDSPIQAVTALAPAIRTGRLLRRSGPLAAPSEVPPPEERAFETAVASATRPGESAPSGMVNREQLRAALEAVRPLWKECFDDAAVRYPGPQRAQVQFTLEGEGPGGRLRNGRVRDVSVGDPYLEACLTDSMLDARYEAPAGAESVEVRYGYDYVPAAPSKDVR